MPRARSSKRYPRLLTARGWPRTKKKIRERITYIVRGLDSLWAVSTFLGVSLTTAQAHRTAAKHQPRRIAIFGGSFDPIHNGHLSVARAADRRFNFDELHLIPASRPPHKLKQHLAPFPHRFAMISLASTEHPHFIPSLAEAGEDFSGTQLHYSVDTARYFRHRYHGDGLFFIIGADAFLDIPMWKEYETLLGLCDFIIANRPGIRPEALRLVIPPELMARPDAKREAEYPSQVVAHLHKSTIYLLENVSSDVSATDVRRHAHRGQSIHGLVSARVEEYILKQGLYR
ncbi:MAG: nicotinate (nicotinamide) nucleotide adenylyltransferase [Acidobacteria bacterium]|nr:MAG: nicotinate (nicotinamide) nucleotide adenylyltransferase [Acidobacteriota bacterium]